ncbi:hypothetical protein [Aurantimonas sp. VKM B-3413]|uniref:hypothetical protein n=1 Tax=Aurantimonas sp. VKM B-3413 TaxID=2779401 RepID=UPI001E31CDA9|nr:hypothetical protein [Aurantimonas sp. VKM B-3413]MCB8840201.1 hypothetical protein [Aurantimonas sp. VKM B-3413]
MTKVAYEEYGPAADFLKRMTMQPNFEITAVTQRGNDVVVSAAGHRIRIEMTVHPAPSTRRIDVVARSERVDHQIEFSMLDFMPVEYWLINAWVVASDIAAAAVQAYHHGYGAGFDRAIAA